MSSFVIQIIYFTAAICFILGLKRMSLPKTATSGIHLAGIGMLGAILASFFFPEMHNLGLILLAMLIGSVIAGISAKKVTMTAIPEMIALYNGMGGGAAALIAANELIKAPTTSILALSGALIGSISFSGSILAFLKLRNWLKNLYFPLQQKVNLAVLGAAVICGSVLFFWHSNLLLVCFFSASLSYGILLTLGIGGADMPVVIALFNAFTGLAVACEGLVIKNIAMVIAGTIVGAAGTLLTLLMAKAMNRSLTKILFARFGEVNNINIATGDSQTMEAADAAIIFNYVNKIVFIPGYGMAVAQAQQKVWELASLLIAKGIEVTFAIHPVAGRMPGHMNVLLAEAGVPYDYIADLEDINSEFIHTDVAIVIGANDVVNPAAREDKSSPIYGMPILNADFAKQIFVIKRGKGKGYAGVENLLFYNKKCHMVYGDAKNVLAKMIATLKEQT